MNLPPFSLRRQRGKLSRYNFPKLRKRLNGFIEGILRGFIGLIPPKSPLEVK